MSAARSTVATLDELVGARTDIDHNGRRLSVRSLGGATGGAPGAGSSVLWLAGMGMSANYLAPLHQRIARETRSVLFDRAGLGRSDPDTRPRTLERAADEVIAVLEALELDDAVLVAHSWGGPIARVAAARVPHRVRALVLLDPSDEHTRVGALLAHRRRGAALARATRLAGMLGQLRLLCARGYHPAVLAELRAVDLSARAQSWMR
jgi:pimeloyl-ACP methyl ester carboxylesterase